MTISAAIKILTLKMSNITKNDILKLQVSSVLRNDKNLGKQNIFDGNDDTCWNSNEGSPQWIQVEFKEPHTIYSFSIQFQGGFVGKICEAEFSNNGQLTAMPFYPEDVNSVQKFTLAKPVICKQFSFTHSMRQRRGLQNNFTNQEESRIKNYC